jgi:hypothetical protein
VPELRSIIHSNHSTDSSNPGPDDPHDFSAESQPVAPPAVHGVLMLFVMLIVAVVLEYLGLLLSFRLEKAHWHNAGLLARVALRLPFVVMLLPGLTMLIRRRWLAGVLLLGIGWGLAHVVQYLMIPLLWGFS